MIAASLSALAACQPGGPADEAVRTPAGAAGPALLGADVESPDVFSVTDRALWDGRPSLGGIWVAAPGVTEPERVLIAVPETGRSVIGALFRREREFAGPPLQLSSEAADALGIYAGAPTQVRVVALRRAAAPDLSAALPPPPAPAPDPADSASPAVATVGTTAATAPPRRNILQRLFRRGPQAGPATVEEAATPAPDVATTVPVETSSLADPG